MGRGRITTVKIMAGHRYQVSFTGGQYPGAGLRTYAEPLTVGRRIENAGQAYKIVEVVHAWGARAGQATAKAVPDGPSGPEAERRVQP